MRHGHEASFVTPDGEDVVDLGTVVRDECDRLGVDGLREVYGTESGATRQRRLRDEAGLDGLCAALRLA
jgi:carboxylate-amine ligase